MTPQERLNELEAKVKSVFGCWTRYLNDVFEYEEAHGAATSEQKCEMAQTVIRGGGWGIAGHMHEENRRRRLGRPENP